MQCNMIYRIQYHTVQCKLKHKVKVQNTKKPTFSVEADQYVLVNAVSESEVAQDARHRVQQGARHDGARRHLCVPRKEIQPLYV